MSRKWTKIAVIAVLILLPLFFGTCSRESAQAIHKRFAYPNEFELAAGSAGGRYRPLGDFLVKEINASPIGSEGTVRSTAGSLENLRLLRDGEVEFALYQPDTAEVLAPDELDSFDEIAFVANLYSQPVHFVVREGVEISSPADLKGRTVQLGVKDSGDYALSVMLLEAYGLSEEEVTARHLSYEETRSGFEAGTLDVAFITVGMQASVFQDLFAAGKCELRSLPNCEALTWNRLSMAQFRIPKGVYGAHPAQDVETVALGAQLLVRKDLPAGFVKEVTGLLMEERFLKENGLREIYLDASFAQERPAFTMHDGARSFYEHGFDIHIFEALDAMYSLIASVFIATFLLLRSWRSRRAKNKEHRLDTYMQKLLEIEREQVSLDSTSPKPSDLEELQKLLDKVTYLRQEALKELTAHELNGDSAANAFVEMCHALSNKINAKITRLRFDQGVQRIAEAVERVLGEVEENSAGKAD